MPTEPSTTQYLPVVGVELDLVHIGPTISLHIIEIDRVTFPEGEIVAVIPIARLENPVRIGRRDLGRQPPICPELDLTDVVRPYQSKRNSVVSRLHAALQLENGEPVIKPVVDHSNTTWLRHTGDRDISPIPPNTRRQLRDRDIILLGDPHGRNVQLRVVLSHPTP